MSYYQRIRIKDAKENLDTPGQPDQKDFELLLKLIRRRECAVFIGAGISRPVGYPSLQELLQIMATEANIDEFKEKEITDNWMDDFQLIQTALGQKLYRECLIRIFDHTTKHTEFSSVHLNVMNIPFCAYVTTNYDPCLEFAARHSPRSHNQHPYTYPNLPQVELKGEHIFHIHGYIDPKNHDSVNSLVLSREEYDAAYQTTEVVPTFLSTLFQELDVLFIGFGWNDFKILENIKEANKSRKVRESVATQRDIQLARERYKFAIIDSETYLKDKGSKDYIGAFGVKPLIYEIQKSHYPLSNLLQSIQEGTSKIPIAPIPSLPEGNMDIVEAHE